MKRGEKNTRAEKKLTWQKKRVDDFNVKWGGFSVLPIFFGSDSTPLCIPKWYLNNLEMSRCFKIVMSSNTNKFRDLLFCTHYHLVYQVHFVNFERALIRKQWILKNLLFSMWLLLKYVQVHKLIILSKKVNRWSIFYRSLNKGGFGMHF